MTHAYFRYSEKFFTKGTKNGNSGAIAKASYRAAEKLQDTTWQYKTINDRSNREHIAYKCIHTPEGTPERLADRETLWNEVMAVEKAKNSTYAREIELSFDNNMSLDECIQSLEKWVKENLTDRGYIADACIHWKDGNHHAHIMTPDRTYNVEKDQWDPKASKAYEVIYNNESVICKTKAELDKTKEELESQNIPYEEKQKKVRHDNMRDKSIFQHRRDSWAEYQNEILSERGLPLVSSKNLEAQGLQKGRTYLSRKSYEKYKKEKELKAELGSEYTYPRENERIYIRHRKDDLEKLDVMIKQIDQKIAEESKTPDIDLDAIALKTVPERTIYRPGEEYSHDIVPDWGVNDVLVADEWMRRYNKYMEKAGREDLKIIDRSEMRKYLESEETAAKFAACEIYDPIHERALRSCLPREVYGTKAQLEDADTLGVIVLERMRRSYNRSVTQAGREDLRCETIYDMARKVEPDYGGDLEMTYPAIYRMYEEKGIKWDAVQVKRDDPRVIDVNRALNPEAYRTHTPTHIPTPTKKAPPVQTAHSRVGQALAAGIEDLGARSGGQAVSEQVVDDMTQGYSRLIAALVRVLADLLKQMTKEIRKDPKRIKEPIKDLKSVKKEEPKKEPVKPKEEKKEQPKKYIIKNPTASEILDIRLDCARDVDDRQALVSLKSLLKSMTKSQVKAFDNKVLESKKVLTFAEMKDIAVEIITASGSGGKNRDKNKDQSVDLER